MSATDLSVGQMMLALEDSVDDLAVSPDDLLTRRANFARVITELSCRTPEVEHVDAELERLTSEADALRGDATPEQAMAFVSALASLYPAVKRQAALATLIAELAERLEDAAT